MFRKFFSVERVNFYMRHATHVALGFLFALCLFRVVAYFHRDALLAVALFAILLLSVLVALFILDDDDRRR